jgi:hypothetical protein
MNSTFVDFGVGFDILADGTVHMGEPRKIGTLYVVGMLV